MAIPNVLNNPPICYIASLNNLCGPPTTNGGATVITAANASTTATVPPGPGAFSQNFMGQSYIPGPWLVNGDPSQGGYPAGGCIYPSPNPATNNLLGSVNNQVNGGFEWDCDGALAMIDPVYVDKGPKQPNILALYPMTNPAGGFRVAVGQPYDGVWDANNTFPAVLAACPNFQSAVGVVHNPLLPAPGGAATCPNGLKSAGSATYVGGAYSGPPLGDGIVYHGTAGSVGGVVYLPYCSPGSIALGPTDIPGGYDGSGAGDVSSLTTSSTGRNSTFANIFLGCNPYWNGNNSGTGQGQLTVNIQENYSLALNTISATSNPAYRLRAGRPRSRVRVGVPAILRQPIRSDPVRSMTLSCRVRIPRSTRFRCSLTTTTTSTRPPPRAASPSILRCRRPMAVAPAAGRIRSCRRTP